MCKLLNFELEFFEKKIRINFSKNADILDVFLIIKTIHDRSLPLNKIILTEFLNGIQKKNDITHFLTKRTFLELLNHLYEILNKDERGYTEDTHVISQFQESPSNFVLEFFFTKTIDIFDIKILNREKALDQVIKEFRDK